MLMKRNHKASKAPGGTKMWCPHCKNEKECKKIPKFTKAGGKSSMVKKLPTHIKKPTEVQVSGQRYQSTKNPDIHWFRRIREYLTCKTQFETVELHKNNLDELEELRRALHRVKANAEAYVEQSQCAAESLKEFTEQSQQATESLQQLTAALEVLRALKIYTNASV